ncbi:uncharacterized protein [Haliotis asinina]|uniref:uncharacterized protein n=1 Tax=Haliotis asinina TaxID=109174 RepID=UPI003531AB53
MGELSAKMPEIQLLIVIYGIFSHVVDSAPFHCLPRRHEDLCPPDHEPAPCDTSRTIFTCIPCAPGLRMCDATPSELLSKCYDPKEFCSADGDNIVLVTDLPEGGCTIRCICNESAGFSGPDPLQCQSHDQACDESSSHEFDSRLCLPCPENQHNPHDDGLDKCVPRSPRSSTAVKPQHTRLVPPTTTHTAALPKTTAAPAADNDDDSEADMRKINSLTDSQEDIGTRWHLWIPISIILVGIIVVVVALVTVLCCWKRKNGETNAENHNWFCCVFGAVSNRNRAVVNRGFPADPELEHLQGSNTEIDEPAEQADDPPGEPGVPPGQPVNTPEQPGDTLEQPVIPPGQPVNTPEQPGDTLEQPVIPPGQPVNTPEQLGDTLEQPGVPPQQPGDTLEQRVIPPGQPGVPPGQPGVPPGQPVIPPGQPGDLPEQSGYTREFFGYNDGLNPPSDPPPYSSGQYNPWHMGPTVNFEDMTMSDSGHMTERSPAAGPDTTDRKTEPALSAGELPVQTSQYGPCAMTAGTIGAPSLQRSSLQGQLETRPKEVVQGHVAEVSETEEKMAVLGIGLVVSQKISSEKPDLPQPQAKARAQTQRQTQPEVQSQRQGQPQDSDVDYESHNPTSITSTIFM